MKRKLRRSIYCIVCVLILLSVSCIAAFADVPMYSAGVSDAGANFVAGPTIFARQDCTVRWKNSNSETFTFNSFLQPCFPAGSSYVSDYYFDNATGFFYNYFGDETSYDYSCEYDNYSYNNLSIAPGTDIVSGTVRADFSYILDVYSKSVDSVSWHDYILFTVRDFYCWSDASEVVFGLIDSNFSFDYSVIVYSVNGSDEILEHTIYYDDNSAYSDLHFSVINEYLPDVSSSDVVYIYSWEVMVDNGPTNLAMLSGYIEYNFNPNVRSIDISAGDGFDSDNPAVPLLDYTAWIGTAVSGFLDLQIFPNFTLGGVLMTLLAFTCVIWFLKLVAGG